MQTAQITAAPGKAAPETPVIPPAIVTENLARVQELISKHGKADVIVYLRSPDGSVQEPGQYLDQVVAVQESVLSSLAESEFSLYRKFETTPGFAGKVTEGGLRKLLSSPDVLMVYEDQQVQAELNESVPMINADDVQAMGIRGEGVTVAVLDTGIDTDHPALADDLLGQKCFARLACPPGNTSTGDSAEDGDGHGTGVAGIITSSGAVVSMPTLGAGVAPDAGIVAVKVLDNSGRGYLSDWVRALEWVVSNRVAYKIRVVNMSLGTLYPYIYSSACDNDFPNLRDAVNSAVANGIVVFAASGNEASGTSLSAPACLGNVISVGAVYDANVGGVSFSDPDGNYLCSDSFTYADKVACFSNISANLNVLAPSYRNTTTGIGGVQYSFGGTSAASPHAAAVAALLLSSEPNLTPAAIKQRLMATGKSISITRDIYSYTLPRVDALAAVLAGSDPTCVSLTLNSSPAGWGTATASPVPNCNWGTEYTANTDVTITAVPIINRVFNQWNGDATGTLNPLVVKMAADTTITANFVGDAYEVDGSFNQAKTITDGVPQAHNIIPSGDVDFVKFTLTSTSAVRLETSGATGNDTYMWLYDSNQALIAENNDTTGSHYSMITRTCAENSWLPSGTYYIKVNNFYPYSEINSYNLSYTRTQTCTNAPPEIDVRYDGNGPSILNGDSIPSFADGTHFGLAEVAGSTTRVFRIWNTGGADLHLIGSPAVEISGANAADFTIENQPTSPVSAGDHSVQFMVRFTPSGTGLRTATIRIASDDADEDMYTFAIEGLGVSTLYTINMPVIAR